MAGLKKIERLLTRKQFERVRELGHKKVGRYFVVVQCANELTGPRLGLVVSRKVGSAVKRNRIKRIIREHFRQKKSQLPGYDYVVIARVSAADQKAYVLRQDLDRLWS